MRSGGRPSVAAAAPKYLDRASVSPEDIEKERSIFKVQAEGSGKPAAVIDKIVDGKLGKYYEEVCLLEQKFVKDPDKTIDALQKEAIAKLGENITIKRFVRFQLGETAKSE